MDDKFKDVKFVISDFDGIFTDGKIEIFSDGKTSKRVDYRDLMGLAVILKRGINFAIISGDTSVVIDLIKQKFPQIETFQNEHKKIDVLKSLIAKYGFSRDNVIYLGDDINDKDCLSYVKYPVTVQNAHESIKKIDGIYITKNVGGNGAFREVTDLIL